jgi:hypothetical protein
MTVFPGGIIQDTVKYTVKNFGCQWIRLDCWIDGLRLDKKTKNLDFTFVFGLYWNSLDKKILLTGETEEYSIRRPLRPDFRPAWKNCGSRLPARPRFPEISSDRQLAARSQ